MTDFQDMLDGLISIADAARLVGVTPNRIRQMCQAGSLQHYRSANGRLIPRDAVDALIATRNS